MPFSSSGTGSSDSESDFSFDDDMDIDNYGDINSSSGLERFVVRESTSNKKKL